MAAGRSRPSGRQNRPARGRSAPRSKRPRGRSQPRSTRSLSRRERKNLHVAAYLAIASGGLALGIGVAWPWVFAAMFAISFLLAFRWPTLCRAYRTDGGICEMWVNGWLTGCNSHAPVKRRDLRAVMWPPNEVSPFHRAALAMRIPPRESEVQAVLDGAPRRITMRNLTVSSLLVLSGLMVLVGAAVGSQ